MDRVKDMQLMISDNFSKRDTIRVSLRTAISEILGKGTKTGIEITREKNRALGREGDKGRDKFSETTGIVRIVTRRRRVKVTKAKKNWIRRKGFNLNPEKVVGIRRKNKSSTIKPGFAVNSESSPRGGRLRKRGSKQGVIRESRWTRRMSLSE